MKMLNQTPKFPLEDKKIKEIKRKKKESQKNPIPLIENQEQEEGIKIKFDYLK